MSDKTLSETLEALDALKITDCRDSSCLFAASRSGMRTNGGCRAIKDMAHTHEELRLLLALAAVVKVAREEVARQERERIARFDADQDVRVALETGEGEAWPRKRGPREMSNEEQVRALVRRAREAACYLASAIDIIANEDVVDPNDGESAEAWETVDMLCDALEPFNHIAEPNGKKWKRPEPSPSVNDDDEDGA